MQAVRPRDGLQKAVLLELLVDVEHLTQRRVEQLAAHDQNVDFTIAEPVLDGFLVAVGIPVLLHHLVPEGDDQIVRTLVDVIDAFAHVGRRDNDGAVQVAELLKALQIADRVALVVGGEHGLEAGILVALNEVLADVQRDALDARVGGG